MVFVEAVEVVIEKTVRMAIERAIEETQQRRYFSRQPWRRLGRQ